MANVAGSRATGPASPNAVSGGTKFPLKEKQGSVGGPLKKMNNQSAEAQRAIMALRYNGGTFPKTTEQAFTGKKAPR